MNLQMGSSGSSLATALWIGLFAWPVQAATPIVPGGPGNPVFQAHVDRAPTRMAHAPPPTPPPVARPEHSAEFKEQTTAFKRAFADFDAKRAELTPAERKTGATSLAAQLADLEPAVSAPIDRLVYGDWQRQVGTWTADSALIAKGLQAMLDSGLLQPNLVPTTKAMLGNIAFAAKDYPTVIRLLAPMQAASAPGSPGLDDAVPQMLAEAYAATGQPQAGLDVLKSAITARTAANRAAPADWYDRGLHIAFNAKLSAQAIAWSQLFLTAYPAPLTWLGAVQVVRFGYPDFTDEEELDLGRLLDQTGALKLDARYSSLEYLLYLKAIDARRFPGEAVRIAEQGISNGILKPDDPFVKNLLDLARPLASRDKAARAKDVAAQEPGPASGKAAAEAGDAWLSSNDWARAEESCTLALAKGVADNQDRVLTRLGIAQIGQGKYAEAKITLGKVAGARAPIAQLWAIFADQKAAGKLAPGASPDAGHQDTG